MTTSHTTGHRARSRIAVLVATVGVVVLTLGPSSTASADQTSDGLWYYTAFHVQAAHDAGFTGAGVTIAVIDDQLYPGLPEFVGADIVPQPALGCKDLQGNLIPTTSSDYAAYHGTNVTALIVGSGMGYGGARGVQGVAPKAKVLFFSAGLGSADIKDHKTTCESFDGNPVAKGIVAAVTAGAQIISISQVGGDNPELAAAVTGALRQGVVIVAGLSNTLAGEYKQFPGQSNGVVGVQAIDSAGNIQTTDGTPNVNPSTEVAGPGVGILIQGGETSKTWQSQSLADGTSLATPVVAGFLALVKQKYPKATGNQLIQTLIHNTGAGNHKPSLDASNKLGYGVVSVTSMLKVEPTTYPDVNPLVSTAAGASPTAQQIAGKPTASPSPTVSTGAAGTGGSSAAPPSWLLPVLVGGGIVLLLVILAIVLVIVFATRRARRTGAVK